jgi:hypothetical protein
MTKDIRLMIPVTVAGRERIEDVTAMDLIGAVEDILDAAARDPEALRSKTITDDRPITTNAWVLRHKSKPGLVYSGTGDWLEATPEDLDPDLIKSAAEAAHVALPVDALWTPVERVRAEVVPVEMWSDDHRVLGVADAAPWLEQAEAADIIDLEACGWRSDYPADAVAHWLDAQGEPSAKALFAYLSKDPSSLTNDAVGFEAAVDENAARAWLARHRPEVKLDDLEAVSP